MVSGAQTHRTAVEHLLPKHTSKIRHTRKDANSKKHHYIGKQTGLSRGHAMPRCEKNLHVENLYQLFDVGALNCKHVSTGEVTTSTLTQTEKPAGP